MVHQAPHGSSAAAPMEAVLASCCALLCPAVPCCVWPRGAHTHLAQPCVPCAAAGGCGGGACAAAGAVLSPGGFRFAAVSGLACAMRRPGGRAPAPSAVACSVLCGWGKSGGHQYTGESGRMQAYGSAGAATCRCCRSAAGSSDETAQASGGVYACCGSYRSWASADRRSPVRQFPAACSC